MKLSDETLQELANIIIGPINEEGDMHDINGYDTDVLDTTVFHSVMAFFFDIEGVKELDVPTTTIPIDYTIDMLKIYNNTDEIKNIVEKILSPSIKDNEWGESIQNKTNLAISIQPYFKKDGYKLVAVIERREIMESYYENAFHYRILDEKEFAETPAMEENKKVQDIITKAKERFTREDYEGAITSSFNLAETVIKNKLDELGISYKGKPQFVDCYPLLAKELNLNPAGENIESYLQQILQGLESQMKGLYHLGNKAGDRHTPKHPPKRQDAKLAMNAAFTLCEYLSDTHKSRQAQ